MNKDLTPDALALAQRHDDGRGECRCDLCTLFQSNGQHTVALTGARAEALDELRRVGYLFPVGRGRYRDITASGHRYSRSTLQSLVTAGLARWDDRRTTLHPVA